MSSDEPRFIPFRSAAIPTEAGLERGERLYAELDTRRSVRFFSDAPVPRAMIETAIRTASTAPSGAHMQPWTFVAISDPEVKRRIRIAAEREEHALYEEGRISEEWREALEPLFAKYGVDLYICGHVHSYERTLPVLNGTATSSGYHQPTSTSHVMVGGAGAGLSHSWSHRQPQWSKSRVIEYAVGVIEIPDAHTLTWKLMATDKPNGTAPLDTFTITK